MSAFITRWIIGPVYVTAFSFRLEDFFTLFILPVLFEKQSLLVGLFVSISIFFFTIGEPPLDWGLKPLELYLLKSLGSG